MTTVTEQTEMAATKANKKPRVGARRGNVAPAKAKAGKKATPANKAPKGRTKAKVARAVARSGSKTEKILEMLKRPGGVTAKELLKVTGWQAHSLRGFISTAGRKYDVRIESAKNDAGERVYRVAK